MKVDLEGNWVGMTHWRDMRYTLDYFSSPDHWEIGFDIVYRILFFIDKDNVTFSLYHNLKEAFQQAFNLSEDHFVTPMIGSGSVFWRIYWDRQEFDLELLEKCEKYLDECAERNQIKAELLEITVIPRSISQIKHEIKHNSGE
jgi:hypothetical protein